MSKYGGKKLTGKHPLAYMGVEPTTPNQMVSLSRAPTSADYIGYDIGTIWYNTNPITRIASEVWLLIGLSPKGTATWYRIVPGGGGGGTVTSVTAGLNINLTGTATDPIVNLNKSIVQPITNATGTEGLYSLGANHFMHGYGIHNTFLGQSAGNLTLTTLNASENTGVGFSVLSSLTVGQRNSGLGDSSLCLLSSGDMDSALGALSQGSLVDGSRNSSLGAGSLGQLVSGNDNVMLGYGAGYNYTGAESNNIIIGEHLGVLGESNKIRIGVQGSQDKTFIAGISGVTTDVAVRNIVFADTAGQLGTGAAPANGQVLIGGTSGPQWANLSAGAGVGIVVGDHSITISAGGGAGGLITMHTDGGAGHDATIDGVNAMTVNGLGPLVTDGAANAFSVGLTAGNDGEFIIGRTGTTAVWGSLVSGDASINIIPGAGTIDIRTGGGGGGASAFPTDSGTANSALGILQVLGGDNINTAGATNIVTVNLDKSIDQPITNDGVLTDEGMYYLGGHYFLHNYGTANTFLGEDSGNRTLTGTDNTCTGSVVGQTFTSATSNSLYGSNCGTAITSANANCGYGRDSLQHVTTGGGNVSVGFQNLNGITTGQLNISLGYQGGSAHITGDSSNIDIGSLGVASQSGVIRIGTPGAGLGTQQSCYVAGIYGVSPAGGGLGSVVIDANGQLGSVGVGAAGTYLYSDGTNISWHSELGGGTVTQVLATSPLSVTPAIANQTNYTVGLTAATNGQIIIGRTGTTAIWNTITQGQGITVTNASGSITIGADFNDFSYVCNTGSAVPNASGVLNILGGAAIKTTGSVNTITIDDTLTINAQTGLTYTLVLGDAGKFITRSNAAANTVTIPPNGSVNFPVGTQVIVQQIGAGQTSIVAGVGVTINSPGGRLKCAEQYSMAALVQVSANVWSLGGDIVA